MSCATILDHQLPKKERCELSIFGLPLGEFEGYAVERILFARAGNLARRWWLWCGASLMVFGIATRIDVAAVTGHPGSRLWEVGGDAAFVLSGAASSLAFLALFVRFAGKLKPVIDSFSEKACGIYLAHHAFASWLQLALLKAHLSTIGKGALVFGGASILSWGTAVVLRRVPLAALAWRLHVPPPQQG